MKEAGSRSSEPTEQPIVPTAISLRALPGTMYLVLTASIATELIIMLPQVRNILKQGFQRIVQFVILSMHFNGPEQALITISLHWFRGIQLLHAPIVTLPEIIQMHRLSAILVISLIILQPQIQTTQLQDFL